MIKILVIDDEQGICDIIEKTFSYIGFSVFTATSAEDAIRLLNKEQPKIVFLDLIMPHKDGEKLLKELKTIDPKVIVIVVTAKKDEKAKQEVLKQGVDEYITKPFSRNYLRDVVVQKIHDVLDKGGHMLVPKILIVDDEIELRKNLKEYIKPRFVCTIDEASNATEALHKVQELKPDIICLDVKMPGLSGLDVIKQMKQTSPLSKIIVVSAWNSAEVVNTAIRLGAEDYISKPLSLAMFGDKLKAVLLSMGKLIIKNV